MYLVESFLFSLTLLNVVEKNLLCVVYILPGPFATKATFLQPNCPVAIQRCVRLSTWLENKASQKDEVNVVSQ